MKMIAMMMMMLMMMIKKKKESNNCHDTHVRVARYGVTGSCVLVAEEKEQNEY